jgi:hypothetical protein
MNAVAWIRLRLRFVERRSDTRVARRGHRQNLLFGTFTFQKLQHREVDKTELANLKEHPGREAGPHS